MMRDQIESSWSVKLGDEFEREYWPGLESFVCDERAEHGDSIFPPPDQVFAALHCTPFDRVKVVLLGQDPYHGPGQAHGLSFSVPTGLRLPPSLRNIFRELADDLEQEPRTDGCLADWATQGVLLLNTVLTVRRAEANSHRKRGWEQFTDAIIERLSARERPVVFLLWGAPAQKKVGKIDTGRHLVFTSPHPSPLSARRGFFGSRPFSKVNEALAELGEEPIDWYRSERN